MLRTGNLQNLDLPLVLCTLAAAAVGIIMVFSATKAAAAPGGTLKRVCFTPGYLRRCRHSVDAHHLPASTTASLKALPYPSTWAHLGFLAWLWCWV
jgi:hypothetical protein